MGVLGESATIVNALRSGLVPSQGLEHFATGLDPLLAAVNQELDFVAGFVGGDRTLKRLRRAHAAQVLTAVVATPGQRLDVVEHNGRLRRACHWPLPAAVAR